MSEATVRITSIGLNKIAVIKAVREITNLGLKEAKDLIDTVPKTLMENVPQSTAEAAAKKLKDAGAEVEIEALGGHDEVAAPVVGKNADLSHLAAVCFPKQPDVAKRLEKYVDEFGLSLGWYLGLIRAGIIGQ